MGIKGKFRMQKTLDRFLTSGIQTGLTALLSENAPKAMKEHDIKTVNTLHRGESAELKLIVKSLFLQYNSSLAEKLQLMRRCKPDLTLQYSQCDWF